MEAFRVAVYRGTGHFDFPTDQLLCESVLYRCGELGGGTGMPLAGKEK